MSIQTTPRLSGCEVLPSLASAKPPRHPPKGTKRPKSSSSGRFAELNTFIDCTMRVLPPAAVKVWLILFRDTKQNGLAKVGQMDIARRAGVSDRAVRLALRRLESLQLVKVIHRGALGKGPSTYRVRSASVASASNTAAETATSSKPAPIPGDTPSQTPR